MVDEKSKGEEQQTPAHPEEGLQLSADGLIKSAAEAAERLKAENDRREKLLADEKEFYARKLLSGKSEVTQQAAPKVETPKEYAERVMQNQVKIR